MSSVKEYSRNDAGCKTYAGIELHAFSLQIKGRGKEK